MLKRALRKTLRVAHEWLVDEPADVDPTLFYPWINNKVRQIMRDNGIRRLEYAWGILHAAHLAAELKVPSISVLELGVAGGAGLVEMERCALAISAVTGIRIDVYGFDTGQGMPKPEDIRDLPNLYAEGDYRMDVGALKQKLSRAKLLLGPVKETIVSFIQSEPSPIGFVAIDVDFYSSTKDALGLFESPVEAMLPRIQCYLDDILGYTFADFNGERVAISEFNNTHADRKVSPVYGLRCLVLPDWRDHPFTEKMFLAHITDHPQYGNADGTMGRALPLDS